MNSITLLQISESVIQKSAEMAATDPHGIIITVVSVLVVFASLAILHISYYLIGKVVNWHLQWKERRQENAEQQDDPEVNAAIATAMHLYLNENAHDEESYVITIKRKEYNETV